MPAGLLCSRLHTTSADLSAVLPLCLRSWIHELDKMQQSGELKAFLHSLDPRLGDEDGQIDNPLAGTQPKGKPKVC